MSEVKVVRADSGTKEFPEYEVLVDGKKIGRVRRRHKTNTGYYGSWSGSLGKHWGSSRKDVVAKMVAEYERKKAKGST